MSVTLPPMTRDQAAAFVNAQTVAAFIVLESMRAANREAAICGNSPPYGEAEIFGITEGFSISQEAVAAIYAACIDAA